MEFRILGPLEVVDDELRVHIPGGRTASLLAALLLHPNNAVDREALTQALWPSGCPPSAAANLRQYAARCRHLLRNCAGCNCIALRSVPAGYLLEMRRDKLDLTLFEDMIDRGRHAFAQGDAYEARRYLENAVGLWRGTLAQGVALGLDIQHKIQYWEELRLTAYQLLLQARLSLGEYQQAVAELRPLVSAYPLREEFAGMLMLALYRSYRKGDALQIYRETRRKFVESLGLEPAKELQHLQHLILAHDRMLDDRGFTWLYRSSDVYASSNAG